MLIFDNGFMYLRQKYIVPLANHSISNRSINANGIKNVLAENKYTGFHIDGNKFVFEFDEEVLLKAQLADAWKAYIRAVLQRDAASQIYSLQPDYCPNWSIVSDYYFSFFCASTILRLTMRGNMYIDTKLAKSVSGLIMDVYGSPIKFPDGNIEYVINKDDGSTRYELIIQKTDHSTHEAVWLNMEKLITEIYQNSRAKTEEKLLLAAIKNVLNVQGATFPSALRNEVNYQLQYGVLAVTKSVQPTNACKVYTGNWLGELLATNSKEKTLPIREARFCEYTEYLYRLMVNLEYEYRNIEGKNKTLLSYINDKRGTKLASPVYSYNDM